MKIFFSVGEPSGDLHGANLIREIRRRRSDIQMVGYGGPRMAKAGCELHADLTEFAIMWLLRVLLHLRTFLGLLRRADKYFQENRPDAVILIDYPGFNWWIARKAKAQGIPVFYYGAPQMWAWAGWRVKKMRRLVDHVLCKLPFETIWYQQRGCNATYVGHPDFDELHDQQLDPEFLHTLQQSTEPLVTILPGSRTQEVTNNLKWFVMAGRKIRAEAPTCRFAIACFNEKHREIARETIGRYEFDADIHVGRTAELIHHAKCCLACSGSVSLELLYHRKPSVILYWVPRWFFMIGTRLMAKVKFITLVNLLATDEPFSERPKPFDPQAPGADDVPFPEYPTFEDKSTQLSEHVVQWLTDDDAYRRRVELLTELNNQHCRRGASNVAAQYVLDHLPPSAVIEGAGVEEAA